MDKRLEDLDSMAEEASMELIEEKKRATIFVNTQEFKDLVTIIRESGVIDENSLFSKNREIEGLSYEDFTRVCNSVFHIYADNSYEVENTLFLNSAIDLEGVRFIYVPGHDSLYITERI